MRRISILLLPILFLCTVVLAAEPKPTDLERKVDAFLKPLLDEDLISGSILIARKGKVEVAKGYGPANREYGVSCSADTRFRLASMTKSFTAMAVMMLQEDGLLDVDHTLDHYLPDYPNGDRITLHHLLTHTSGVINYSALEDHYRAWTMPHTLEEVIARFRDEPLRFEPGERFEYSNSGYVLLTRVIEKVGDMSYEEFLRNRIFTPLGMNHTGTDAHTRIIPLRATGHYNLGEGIVQAPYLNIEFTSGAGGLYSTVLDLYKWDRALYTEKLVSRATLKKIFTPYEKGYGYGWFVRTEFDRKLIEHRGGINGFLTMIQRFVDDDVVVISLFNYVSTFARDVNKGLAAIALGEDYEPILNLQGIAVDAETLKTLVGKYRIGDSVLEVTYEAGRLWLTDPDQVRSETIPQTESRFFARQANAVLVFEGPDDGAVEKMILLQSEHVIPCPRLEENPGS